MPVNLCWFPLLAPLANSFFPLNPFSLTWNPSSSVVRSRPPWSQVARKLTSPSPFPPHSKFPSPQGIPSLIVRPIKMTSRSWLHIVRNNYFITKMADLKLLLNVITIAVMTVIVGRKGLQEVRYNMNSSYIMTGIGQIHNSYGGKFTIL